MPQPSNSNKHSAKRLTHAARVLRMRELLDARPFLTIAELQQDFGVSRRTVYNDLAALEAAGVPIYSEEGPAGEARWKLEHSAKKNTLTLAAGQVVPFGLALQALSFLRGTEVHDQLETILAKLSVGGTPQAKQQLDELSRKVAIVPHGPKSYANKVDVLDDILSGLLYDRLVEIWYCAAGRPKPKRHVVAPLTLVLYREALYLIGESQQFGSRLVFAVDRLERGRAGRGPPGPRTAVPDPAHRRLFVHARHGRPDLQRPSRGLWRRGARGQGAARQAGQPAEHGAGVFGQAARCVDLGGRRR